MSAYVRSTSREAYEYIVASGILGKRRTQTYAYIFDNGPCTGQEIAQRVPNAWKRLSELKEMGLVIEVGERECRVTHVNVIAWDVTEKMPTSRYKRAIERRDDAYKAGYADGLRAVFHRFNDFGRWTKLYATGEDIAREVKRLMDTGDEP